MNFEQDIARVMSEYPTPYLTGVTKKIPVTGKRTYTVRIKVNRGRKVKAEPVKKELGFLQARIEQYQAVIRQLTAPKESRVRRFVSKLVEVAKRGR